MMDSVDFTASIIEHITVELIKREQPILWEDTLERARLIHNNASPQARIRALLRILEQSTFGYEGVKCSYLDALEEAIKEDDNVSS